MEITWDGQMGELGLIKLIINQIRDSLYKILYKLCGGVSLSLYYKVTYSAMNVDKKKRENENRNVHILQKICLATS